MWHLHYILHILYRFDRLDRLNFQIRVIMA